jgi:UDP-N-acetylglucosamine 1-carboxyvinyltransferase
LVAGAISRGCVTVDGIGSHTMKAVMEALKACGAKVTETVNSVTVDMEGRRPKSVDIVTAPYPGFPTDMQAQWMVLNCVAEGTSVIEENVFENRFMHVQELQRMGADIRLSGHIAVIHGQPALGGAEVTATDLRASASLVLAGIIASGRTRVHRVYHLDRGYEHIEDKLVVLGVPIKRITE